MSRYIYIRTVSGVLIANVMCIQILQVVFPVAFARSNGCATVLPLKSLLKSMRNKDVISHYLDFFLVQI